MTISLVLADDHPIVLDGLERLFGLEPDFAVRARCRDGEQAIRAVRLHRPDVLILDVSMPGKDGIEVLRTLAKEGGSVPTVLLTVAMEEEQIHEAVALGVRGIVLKEMAPQLLVEAIREVHAGGQWLETGPVGRALRGARERREAARAVESLLTPRETEIVRMVASGMRNRAIAEELFITEGTVKIHLHNIYQKLRVTGRVELAVYARGKGLV